MATYQYQRAEAGATNVTFTTLARLVDGLGIAASELVMEPDEAEGVERFRAANEAMLEKMRAGTLTRSGTRRKTKKK